MPDPKNPGDRVKASKFRTALARGQKLDPVDRLWFDEYEQQTARETKARASGEDYGRSKSARRVRLEVDEAAEAEGTGSAAAAAALAAREEGRRIDSLALGSQNTMREACEIYKDICLTLKENFEILSDAVVQSMTSQRAHYLAAGEMELALRQAQTGDQGSDPAQEMIMLLLAKQLGLAPEEMTPVRAAAAAAAAKGKGKRPPPNGAKQ